VVVDAEVNETNKTTPGSERRILFKKGFNRADIVRDARVSSQRLSGLVGQNAVHPFQSGQIAHGSNTEMRLNFRQKPFVP